MKRFALYGAMLVLVSVIAIPSVFAATNNDSKVIDFFRSRLAFHRDQIHRDLDQGEITQGEADKWNGYFDYMEEFQSYSHFLHKFFIIKHYNRTYKEWEETGLIVNIWG